MKLYFNGPILTMEPGPAPEALLEQDGKITALGPYADLRGPGIEEVDLRGHTLLPAFIDAHSHITALASTMNLCKLGTADSFEALNTLLADFARQRNLEPGAWIMGFAYDHNVMKERAHPTRQVLDRAFPDSPVLITHASGHMGVANTQALALLGIDAHTPDPEGGKIGREADGITPNGYLEENAYRQASGKVPRSLFGDMGKSLMEAQRVYLSHGITLVQDGMTAQNEYNMLTALAERGALTLDVVGYVDMKRAPELVRSPYWQTARHHLKLGGYKIFLDGSPQGRTAWMLDPYQGGDGHDVGYPIYSDDQVTAFICTALSQGVQILAHCNGDAAAAQYIRCCRQAQEEVGKSLREIRPVMIHAQLVRPEQLSEMALLGILPSFFVAHVWYWGDIHRENFGPDRAASISPVSEAVKLGLPFTFHQDTPVIMPDMLESVRCAVERKTRSGVVLGPEYRISEYEALKAVTIHAAYQYGLERERGSLASGKTADLTIVDLKAGKVFQTIKNGQTVWEE